MQVPHFDLKRQYAALEGDIMAALRRACANASFILGEDVARFEEQFAAYCGVKYVVAVNSGTSALHLALLAVGVEAGDEVIATPNTFIATAEAITYTGATPVFADIDPSSANIDPVQIERAITPRTKAIVPVHLYGRPADLDRILAVARRHGLAVVEDACQAHGARYRGKPVGGWGRAAAFSFYPSKNLGAYGEAGALATDDEEIARFARAMRDHGQTRRYLHDRIGYNYRMAGFDGAVLCVKLKYLDEWNARRLEIAGRYRRAVAGAPVELPQDDPQAAPVYHIFAAYVDERDRVREELRRRGVHTAVYYPLPIHLQRACAPLGYGPGSFPAAERSCERVLSMPLFPEMSGDEVDYAADMLAEVALAVSRRPGLQAPSDAPRASTPMKPSRSR